MWELLLLLPLLGFLVAIVASMTGVGGGIFFVPLLTLAYEFAPSNAVGTSLTVIVFTALSASAGYARQKRIFYKTGLLLAVMTIPGSVVGAFSTSVLPGDVLGLVLGFFLVAVVIRMVSAKGVWHRKNPQLGVSKIVVYERDLFLNKKRLVIGVGLGFFGGLVSGLLGVGGGIFLVPLMALFLGISIHAAVATSMFTMIFTSLSGVAQHWSLGNVNLEYALLLAVGALVGAQIGAWICKRTSGETLSLLFAVLILVVSVQMIVKFI